jgi:cyclopropane-fatty-acyl-phospholipid synthase
MLTIRDREGRCVFGSSGQGPSAEISIHDPAFYRRLLVGGVDAVDDAYLRAEWDTDDLTAVFRVFLRNFDVLNRFSSWPSSLARLLSRIGHWKNGNSRAGSRRNIHAHYDLGNDFFRLWLDETLAYSSGIFPTFDASLKEASREKFDRVCRKLNLQSHDHLLEIGSGWGGLAIHAARHYGCRVTTTTISAEQFALARERIRAAGLEDRIDLLQLDYRDLTGQFDKLASIEMIEAVGEKYLDNYFRQCSTLLKPTGSCVIQAIVMPERRYASYLRSVDFIRRRIFPGGSLPSVSAILESVGRTGQLRLSHLEDFSPHYAETLRRWRETFREQVAGVRALGHSEEFIRLWTFYLCYCEAVFEEREVGVVQIHFDGRDCPSDPLGVGQRAVIDFASRHHDQGAACRS